MTWPERSDGRCSEILKLMLDQLREARHENSRGEFPSDLRRWDITLKQGPGNLEGISPAIR